MKALVLVDLQNDFMPWGALPVPDGDAVVPVANALSPLFSLVVATQDWHPAGHASFASSHPGRSPGDVVMLGGTQQVLWPDHCVQHTPGASFHSGLDVVPIGHVVRKGSDPLVDSYSAFFDNDHVTSTGLDAFLRTHGASELVVMGLATDYCVKATVLDALGLGFGVTVVRDGCRAVDVAPGDGERALAAMAAGGARIVESAEVPRL
ncbi:MAG: bifunctional nicotinamidase/pyrazinamidase [Coriobacteriia bacterium]|nr:bifunctional nicotinamidase/pyrazinamidase [Coriobacteriia bacterium]